jgi:hypothetical protein
MNKNARPWIISLVGMVAFFIILIVVSFKDRTQQQDRSVKTEAKTVGNRISEMVKAMVKQGAGCKFQVTGFKIGKTEIVNGRGIAHGA